MFAGEEEGFIYSRLGNPTTALLEQRLASLEGGQAAVAAASGMGAIAASLWTLLRPGDELLTDLTLYGCTFALFHHGLAEFGVTVRHIDMTDVNTVVAAMSKRTRVVYFETPANPNMRLVDIATVAAAAHAHGATVVVDNTYATPFLQRPLELGADLVVHSATKYLGGHGDVIAGAAVGDEELINRIGNSGIKDMTGAVLSPFDAMLVIRGLKTLELRVQRHSVSAMEIARRLEAHPAIEAVHYPGLCSFAQHDLAKQQMNGMFGGVIAFELKGGRGAALPFMNRLKLIRRAVSLGDAETLIQHPATMTHSTYSPEERAVHGISEGLVRLSVGLEHVDDIWEDISCALSRDI